jgi:hypothetical protein
MKTSSRGSRAIKDALAKVPTLGYLETFPSKRRGTPLRLGAKSPIRTKAYLRTLLL